MDDEFRPLKAVRTNRVLTAELAVFALALALAVNLLSSVIGAKLGICYQIGLAVAMLVGALYYVRRRYFSPQHFCEQIEAIVAVNTKTNELIEIPHYSFSQATHSLLKAAIAENAAFKRQWFDDTIWRQSSDGKKISSAAKLLWEMCEYEILTKYAIRMADYYRSEGVSDEDLEVISRSNALEMMEKNRLLDALSRNPKDRAVFADHSPRKRKDADETTGPDDDDPYIDTVSILVPGGARYDLFELKLPKRSSLNRIDGGFSIKTPSVEVRITIDVTGYSRSAPAHFERLILRSPFITTSYQIVNICVEVDSKFSARRVKANSLFYGWIDTFLTQLRQDYSAEQYFSSLQWPNVLATVAALNADESYDELADLFGQQDEPKSDPAPPTHEPTGNE